MRISKFFDGDESMPRLYLVEQSALAVGGHYFAYARTVALAAQQAGLDVTILQNRRFDGQWNIDGIRVISAFHYTWSEASSMWLRDWRAGNLAYDFQTAVHGQVPGKDDHVLFTTISCAELRALLDFFIELPIASHHPTYHILLRYDADVLRDSWQTYDMLFRRVRSSPLLRNIIRFHTDTELLSEEYGYITGVPFSTLPIPFSQERLKSRLTQKSTTVSPLNITYLGDARLEKNFAELPPAIADLWTDYVENGKVRFVLQCNFNTEGGEPGMLQAMQRLGQLPPSRVKLIDRAMEADEYYDILADADIVVIPYDARRYRTRSSGILIEAMAAGKPVITTRGSWMETQVSDDHAVVFSDGKALSAALRVAINEFPRLRLGAEAVAPKLMEWSSGDNYIRTLLSTSQLLPAPVGPRILYLVDGGSLFLRNGASVVARSHLSFMFNYGYSICVLVIMRDRFKNISEVESWKIEVLERLSEFNLDAVFFAGSERFSPDVSGERQRYAGLSESIANDIEIASNFDVNLSFIHHIQKFPPDLIFLNYVVNLSILDKIGLSDLPIICEIHDIQSFQKAIYGSRKISDFDLVDEIALLKRCAHLISLNQTETDYILDILPNANITTIGVSIELKKLDTSVMAGVRDLGELVASCLPKNIDYQWDEARGLGRAVNLERLMTKNSIDLLFVSSNHAANVSGIRWFLTNIYLPHLAPAGVTLVVAGSISDWDGWPSHDNFFLLGQLARLEPLYAAARIVVLPIVEGAGVAIKTLEALAYGRPIVATSTAMRGLPPSLDGVSISDDPNEMRRMISTLLKSEDVCRVQGLAARRSARKLAAPEVRTELLARVFNATLGSVTQPTSISTSVELADDEICPPWSMPLQRINRLVRNWLDNERLDFVSLSLLIHEPREDVERQLWMVLDSLVVKRQAPIISSDLHVAKIVAGCLPQDAEMAREVLMLACDVVRAEKFGAPLDIPNVRIAYNADYALSVVVFEQSNSLNWSAIGRSGSLNTSIAPDFVTGQISKLDLPYSKPKINCVSLDIQCQNYSAIVSQIVFFDGKGVTSSPEVLDSGDVLFLRPGVALRLELPGLFSDGAVSRVIDLVVEAEVPVELWLDWEGVQITPARLERDDEQVLRFMLHDNSCSAVELPLTVNAGTGLLRRVCHRLVMGCDEFGALAQLDRLDDVVAAAPSNDDAIVSSGREQMKRDLQKAIILQRYLLRVRALAARDLLISSENLEAVLRGDWRGFLNARTRQAELAEPEGQVLIASTGISFEIHATITTPIGMNDLRCEVDGLTVEQIGRDGHIIIWRALGREPTEHDDWVRRIRITAGDGQLVELTDLCVLFRFVAGLDRSTGSEFVQFTNVHEPELLSPDLGLVWTGPGRHSRFIAPLALTSDGTITIQLANFGVNREVDDIVLELNGAKLKTQTIGNIITADFPADAEQLSVTELVLSASRINRPDGESRSLGVAIDAIIFRLPVIASGGSGNLNTSITGFP